MRRPRDLEADSVSAADSDGERLNLRGEAADRRM